MSETTYPTPSPQPVEPTIESSIQYWTDGELSVTITDTADPLVQDVAIQVADPGRWLLYIWFVDGAAITEAEALIPPTVPGVSNFKRVTDSTGLVEFEISNDDVPWQGSICAVVIGRTNISDIIVVGV